MPFPPHIARILDDYRVPADTKAALFDLYVSMGDEVLEVFSDVAEGVASASLLTPEDTAILDLESPTIAGHTCKVVKAAGFLAGRVAGWAWPVFAATDRQAAVIATALLLLGLGVSMYAGARDSPTATA